MKELSLSPHSATKSSPVTIHDATAYAGRRNIEKNALDFPITLKSVIGKTYAICQARRA